MKIDKPFDPVSAGTGPVKENAAGKARTAPVAEASRPAAESPLKLSQLSSKLKQIESKLATGDAFDTARVNEIRQAVHDGTYKVNAEAIADKLLSGAHDLFVKRH